MEIQAPPNSGSYFYNYKETHSLVLLALADANDNFIYIDVGCNGRISDGGVFKSTSLHRDIIQNKLGIPQEECLSRRH